MRRFLIIAILFIYSIASFGVTFNYFYCCGKLKTVSFAVNNDEKSCVTKSKKGCCNNKTFTVKLKVDQKSNDQPAFHFATTVVPAIARTDDYLVAALASCDQNPLYKRPPPDNFLSRNVLFCVFRI